MQWLSHRWTIPALATMMLVVSAVLADQAAAAQAVVLDVDGVIGPAVAGYVVRELRAARPGEVGLVVLRMNTPGGLDSSMREINGAILASQVPVATYVAPSGARAASAGTYIAYASAIAAMAPGTNLGAATPIQLKGLSVLPGTSPDQPASRGSDQDKGKTAEPPDAESRKAVNDAAAYIRGLADLNGRNADWAVEAVRTAASLSAPEALRLHVIDVIADDVPDLLRKIDGRTVRVAGRSQTLATAGLEVAAVAPDWRTELLAVITNPNVALILMMIGIYGLIFEFVNPGSVAPGLIGGVSLLVGLYALNLLPINYAGLALVLLGIGLMVAEAHIGAFGVIGVGGIVAFVIGAIMMFPTDVPGLSLSMPLVAIIAAITLGFFLLVLSMLLRSRRRAIVSGAEALHGAEGEAVSWQGMDGRVRISGEIWRARGAVALQPGARIKVVALDGLVVVVEPA